jgi:Arc/MetJ family transcription regulator
MVIMYILVRRKMVKSAIKMTTIRLDMKLANEAAKTLGAKSRSEAVHMALREVVALKRFKDLMTSHGGRFTFEAYGK